MINKDEIIGSFNSLSERQNFTERKISVLKDEFNASLSEIPSSSSISIVATGSYGRLEASEESDLDLFIIHTGTLAESEVESLTYVIRSIVEKNVPKPPGSTGTFNTDVIINLEDMTSNIGGTNDSNENLTRRMLFLLEGKSLFNDEIFQKGRQSLLEKYIKPDIPDHQINKFFLNDIIRYYRTIATDYEYKVTEGSKDWGLRNIKLRFSRKLLYFSGIIVAAETCHKTRAEKIKITKDLLDLPPISRIIFLSSFPPTELLSAYDKFLNQISKKEIRDELESVARDRFSRNENEQFSSLRNLGQHFSWSLSSWLRNKYDTNHPIHHSLLF